MTTYSCTEHWCTGAFTAGSRGSSKRSRRRMEISEELAKKRHCQRGKGPHLLGARHGRRRGDGHMVRLTPFKCGGKTVHQVGMTFNYGWLQPKECGDTANLLSPMVGDANSMTPE